MTAEEAIRRVYELAHEYANNDDTMLGSESLRGYHFFNALNTVLEEITGEYKGR